MPRKKKAAPVIKEAVSQKPKEQVVYQAVGRRKSAIAQARLFAGDGNLTINKHPILQYFSGQVATLAWQKPFQTVGALDKFDGTIKVYGSGKSGQLVAVTHAISRALLKVNPDWRKPLKKQGLLTRDPRVKERRKYGNAQKARAKKQSPRR